MPNNIYVCHIIHYGNAFFSQLPYSTSDLTIFKQDYGFGDGDRDLALKVEDVASAAFYKEAEVAKSFSRGLIPPVFVRKLSF